MLRAYIECTWHLTDASTVFTYNMAFSVDSD